MSMTTPSDCSFNSNRHIQTKHTAVQDLAVENSVLRTFKPVFKIYFSDEQKYSLRVMPNLLTIGKTSKMSTTGA
ncbi:hypothetical protein DPMN_119561 [Dreissena polymorpha]|uniref:Uncharacterized protein n=1 Tax=Dreissena polymorpha TaxID=45954 RepID=A0A9D4GM76_DREPO|nr:hypothetical protein DPMN_119561 [Dreissena polymorpha]